MRSFLALTAVVLGLGVTAAAQTSCTNLCLQQTTCSAGTTTSITGKVFAPNGVDPLPNVQVYVPNAAVGAFAAGVSCPVVGAPLPGQPLVGAVTGVDGKFEIDNMPVGTNIPLVIVSGRWRRQVVIPTVSACANTTVDPSLTHFPTQQSEGDIPKIAIVTGSADEVECVLRKVGLKDTEFTDATGSGRINLYLGTGSAGAMIDSSTPSAHTLMGNSSTLNGYDVLMLPCEGGAYPTDKTATEYTDLVSFANDGGRVYASHFSYQWMYQNSPFNTVANWTGSSQTLPDENAVVDQTFSGGVTLAQWLTDVGASTTPGVIPVQAVKHDLNGINTSLAQSYLAVPNTTYGTAIMQFVWDAPVNPTAQPINQCGRVLFNEYHVENPATSSGFTTFPNECPATAMNAQEKLLEYSLFELTSDGGQPTLTPLTYDFGSEAVGFTTAPATFTWTNNSSFPASVTSAATSGDFAVPSNNCSSVAAGASCQIMVTFTPTALGARTGTLTVVSAGNTLTASLMGTGIPGISVAPSALTFGSVDVGASSTQTVTLTNNAPGGVPLPALVISGDYSETTNCPATVPANSTCTISITFTPTGTGTRTGTLTTTAAGASINVALTGNGIDFSLAIAPASSTLVAGRGTTFVATATPLAGFAAPITLSCTTTAPASTCTATPLTFTLSAATGTTFTLTTTPEYAVIGFGALGGGGLLLLLACGSGWLLGTRRKRTGTLLRTGLVLAMVAAGSFAITGCSGKQPAANAVYTTPGTYSYTVSATDGFLTHTATYSLTVTAK